MFEQIQGEMVKQSRRALELNQQVLSWQLAQATKLQTQWQEQGQLASRLMMDSMRIGMDSMLAAQRATLDAMAPAAAQATDSK